MINLPQEDELELIGVYDPDRNPVDRQQRIEWWDQNRLTNARVMVVGAGAIGNETLKNLALTGFRHIFAVDFDTIEESNLSRAVLFRREDVGKRKVQVAARRAGELAVDPEFNIHWYHGDVVRSVGPAIFAEMDLVLGCLDNIGARVAIDRNCRLAGVPWIDAGIHELALAVSFFDPHSPVSYEATLGAKEKQQSKRLSCFRMKQKAASEGRVATTQIAAAIVAGLQVQETVKYLCNQKIETGKKLFYQGYSNHLDTYSYSASTSATVTPVRLEGSLPVASSCTAREFLDALHAEAPDGNWQILLLHGSFIRSLKLETGVCIPINLPDFELVEEEVAELFEEHDAKLGETAYQAVEVESVSLASDPAVLALSLRQLGFPHGPYVPLRISTALEDTILYYSLRHDSAASLTLLTDN